MTRNSRIMVGHSRTMVEHSGTMAEHSGTMAEHSGTMAEHSGTMVENSRLLEENGLFEEHGDGEEAYYIADDGRLFALSQNIPLAADSRIHEMREIGLRTSIEDGLQPVHSLQVSQPSEGTGHKEIRQILLQGSEMVQAIHEIPGIQEVRENPFSASVNNEGMPGIQLPTVGVLEDIETGTFTHAQVADKLNGNNITIPLSTDSTDQFYFLDNNKKMATLEDFVEVFTIYKCKGCDFTSGERDALHSHIETTHLSSAPESSTQKTLEQFPPDEHNPVGSENVENPELNAMLIISDVNNIKYNMESRTETMILDELPAERSSSYPFFKFFLVKEQKEIFICTRCSVCMASEEKMKIHSARDGCTDSKCNNCGVRFNTQSEYNNHIIKCKVAVFKIKDKPPPGNQEDRNTILSSIPEEQEGDDISLVDQFYKVADTGPEKGGEDEYIGEEYKISRLRRNRTNLEVDGENRVWVCSTKSCHAIFKEEKNLDYHISCHKEDCMECQECKKEFARWPDLFQHLWREHEKDCDMYQCIQCMTYKTSTVNALEKHCQTHANLKLYQCDICYKGFNQQVQLTNHSVRHLRESMVELPNWATPKRCEICQKVCSDSKSLKKHVQAVHSKLKPYICQICGYKTARKGNLLLHVRQHSGEKPYSCDECSYRTGDHNSLRRHKKIHAGDKPNKCHLCSFSTIQSSNLKAHLLNKHHLTPDGKKVEPPSKKRVISTSKEKGRAEKRGQELTLSEKPRRDLTLTDSLDSLLEMSERNGINLLSDTS
ncbi:zinc finger protein 729 isoform X2 [Eurytemora carolleeae]|uniref:zinc finger protein 729 isoform X2 n=1 Tax=Eurytemora carolleeae TaxID=1294199 RepID=UPI000C75843C|nr:zinc finger protein 729 isoform X2 [Eurytemora carolleeae]|eukprot:XP_023330390.1 zinc finger protein 729-like isoform X2 [Eurytemora affinis]